MAVATVTAADANGMTGSAGPRRAEYGRRIVECRHAEDRTTSGPHGFSLLHFPPGLTLSELLYGIR